VSVPLDEKLQAPIRNRQAKKPDGETWTGRSAKWRKLLINKSAKYMFESVPYIVHCMVIV